MTHVYVWANNEVRAKYKGKRCEIVKRLARNSVLLRFEDGDMLVTSRYAIRSNPLPYGWRLLNFLPERPGGQGGFTKKVLSGSARSRKGQRIPIASSTLTKGRGKRHLCPGLL